MRILFLTHAYPPYELGGLTLQCQETVERLRTRGHACHVLTSRYGLDDRAQADGYITRALHFQAHMEHYHPLDFFLSRPDKERENKRILHETIKRFGPDIVFVWGLWNLSRALPYLAEQWMSAGRVAYAIADYWPMEPDIHEAYWRLPARRPVVECAKALIRPVILRQLERDRRIHPLQFVHVMACSEHVANKLISEGVLPHGARVIYNGIDPQPFLQTYRRDRPSRDLRLLYFGGLSNPKGVDIAIKALSIIKERDESDELTLTLVGNGHPDYVEYLRQMVSDLHLSEQVIFKGYIPRTEIPILLSSFDVFLFTSIWEEPFGRTIIEAMAAGLAVIGSYVGGSREIMQDGENALVYPPGDAVALADRILQLKQSPELLQRLLKAGRQTVLERFTLDRMVDEIEEWLHAIATGETV